MMKELQNNYTTVEQSKRLLELGLPADSADCYISNEKIFVLHNCTFQENFNNDLDIARSHLIDIPQYTPCWSVGRLIEIIDNCTICDVKDWEGIVYPSTKKVKQDLGLTYIEFLIQSIGCAMDVLDFSKLN